MNGINHDALTHNFDTKVNRIIAADKIDILSDSFINRKVDRAKKKVALFNFVSFIL